MNTTTIETHETKPWIRWTCTCGQKGGIWLTANEKGLATTEKSIANHKCPAPRQEPVHGPELEIDWDRIAAST